ncbi:MAG TPA: branched-chain amino acid transaminase [bacterium]
MAASKFDETLKIWMNGKMVNWNDATVHIAVHALHYGSSVFEGIRCYKTPDGSIIFGLKQHIRRLFDSAKIYRMEPTWTREDIEKACIQVCRDNNLDACYLRPLLYRGYYSLGVFPDACPIDAVVMPLRWGKYLGAEALEKGIEVCVSSWTRIAPNTLPALAKAGANYMNSQLIKIDAMALGFDEGIALDKNGFVSEGSGENIFLVRDGILWTPPLCGSILPGITRQALLTLARELNIPTIIEVIPREMLYIADEVFFTGTAAELTPIRSVDKVTVGSGKPGPITLRLQEALFDLIEGRRPDPHGLRVHV